ncbi:Uncharacterized protein AXF42_Ash013554 [Apostasia shenzhenica]|uniref:Uncharacterized protein n=1 Tax=Apostasia shenzhenica TaxID=1088818 RepID=A0A2I0AP80_9ASPA|nr:Uncharacterized protein AXF42_Ash013554 [Apostasia shenzhenica]
MHQSRYRSTRDGFRPGPAFAGGGRSSSYGRDLGRSQLNPYSPAAKMDILMEAGRLAAEYLVSKGVIPTDLLPAKFRSGSPPGFERQVRETPPVAEGRTSALARLGQRFPDDDRFGSARRGRSRRRAGPYGSMYGSEWGRESGKPRHWVDRRRSFTDLAEDEDESAPGFGRNRRSGHAGIRSSVSRVSADERPTRSESVSEKNCELADDTGSKASSSSTRRDQQPDADEGTSRVVDEVRVSSSDIMDEVKSERTDELEKKEALDEDMDRRTSCAAADDDAEMKECNDEELDCCKPCIDEGDIEMKDCNDLLKLSRFAKVPTKLRSSLANKIPEIHEVPIAEKCNAVEIANVEEAKDINSNKMEGSELEASEDHSPQSNKYVDEAEESLKTKQNDCFERDIVDSRNTEESRQSMISEIQHSQSSHFDGTFTQDEEMVTETDRQELGSSNFIPETKVESTVMAEEEMRHQHFTTFKICDLNLNGSPDISEIPMGPSREHSSTSVHKLEKDEGVSPDFVLSRTNGVNDACNNNQYFVHDKVVPVIDLEEDSPEEINDLDPSENKNGMSYPSLESVLNQATHTDDLPVIQDGYNLEFPEFMGTDVSGCSSAPGDINNLHTGMGINGAEGYPSLDEHIYVALEEIPMGFMGVWDQPSQDYEKFF